MSQPSASFFKKTASGIFWTGGGRVVRQVTHLITRLILARLLAPEDFGLIATALVVINFTNWFVDMGLGSALIHRKDLTEAHKSTAFWANVFIGWLVFVCLVLIAPSVAAFFDSDQLLPVLIVLSFSVVLGPPRFTLESLFMRDFHFRLVASRGVLSIFLSGVTGIVLAFSGFGVWALVSQTLVEEVTGTLFIFWRSSWRPKWLFSQRAFMDLWSFSMPLAGAKLLNYLNRNLDTILIAYFLGATSLGLYNLGYQLVLLPLIYVTRPIQNVLFTTFARLQDEPKRLRDAYLQALQVIAFITFPLMTILALSASLLVPELLGEKWRPASFLFPFLCLVGLLQSIEHLMPSVFQATDQTSLIFRWNLTALIGNTVAFTVGVHWGIIGVAVGYSLITLILIPILLPLLLRVLNLNWSDFIHALSKTSIATLVLILIWYVSGTLFENLMGTMLPLVKIALQIGLAGGIYLLISWHWNPIVKNTYSKLQILSSLKNIKLSFIE